MGWARSHRYGTHSSCSAGSKDTLSIRSKGCAVAGGQLEWYLFNIRVLRDQCPNISQCKEFKRCHSLEINVQWTPHEMDGNVFQYLRIFDFSWYHRNRNCHPVTAKGFMNQFHLTDIVLSFCIFVHIIRFLVWGQEVATYWCGRFFRPMATEKSLS